MNQLKIGNDRQPRTNGQQLGREGGWEKDFFGDTILAGKDITGIGQPSLFFYYRYYRMLLRKPEAKLVSGNKPWHFWVPEDGTSKVS